jgi:membrane protease YdiL (CAAX protease family)
VKSGIFRWQGAFTIKDAVLLLFFLLGLEGAATFILYLTGLHAEVLTDAVLLGVLLFTARQTGKGTLEKALAFRGVPLQLFCSLLVMYFGLEIVNAELVFLLMRIIPTELDPSGGFPNVFFVIFAGALFPAFTEEIFFRGILLNRLKKTYPAWKAVLISALLFGAAHMNPWQFVHASISGLFYGWIYLRFKCLWVSMFMHAYNNIMAYFLLIPKWDISYNQGAFSFYATLPAWAVIMGFVLFVTGLGLTVGNMRTAQKTVNS